MVSTYLSYDLIQRDMNKSLERVASQTTVEREAAYYKENIGKVKTVDEFMNNYRLYNYAMTAFGLDEMIYAKAFMKKVLESDLTDSSSFANRVEESRYREFAAAFNFTPQTQVLQTDAQLDKIIGLYSATMEQADDALKEEQRYYNIIIGKVTSADELLRNERTRNFILTSYGINDATYNYATLKGAITSDLSDPTSYFNTELAPKRTAAQTRVTEINTVLGEISQRESVIKLIAAIPTALDKAATIQTQIDAAESEPSSPENDAKLETLRAQLKSVFTAIDSSVTDRAGLETLLADSQTALADLNTRLPAVGSDTSALRSQLVSERDNRLASTISTITKYEKIAAAFEFKADGTVAAGSAQTEANRITINELYVSTNPRATRAKALVERDYYESKIVAVTDIKQITGSETERDDRLLEYIKTAFNLTGITVTRQTIENILTADLSDETSGITKEVLADPQKLALHNAFNFQPDGTLPTGETAQTAAQARSLQIGYMTYHNDKDEKADADAIARFKREIQTIKFLDTRNMTSANNFFTTTGTDSTQVYPFVLKALGIDENSVTPLMIKKVLTSDLSDPKSYVYQTKDAKLLQLAQVFNFTEDGKIGSPALVQSSFETESTASRYIVAKSRFGTSSDKTKAEEESKYYSDNITKISSLKEFLADEKLVNVALVANGIDPETLEDGDLAKIFASDLDDPKSFINTQNNKALVSLVTSFNFDASGNLMYEDRSVIQTRRGLYEMHDMYLRSTLETQAGEDNAGVRLALYFERMASSINNYYDVIADTALQEVFRVAFSLSEDLKSMDVDKQVSLLQKSMDIKKLADPDEVKKLITRFTMLYDIENNIGVDPVLGLFSSSAGAGISAGTLLAIAQLR